jgi:hypothetical protein
MYSGGIEGLQMGKMGVGSDKFPCYHLSPIAAPIGTSTERVRLKSYLETIRISYLVPLISDLEYWLARNYNCYRTFQ